MNPDPRIEEHGGFRVVRDDLIPGGTKRRLIPRFLNGADEFVYASPAYGYAQVALAYACAERGVRATVFTAKRNNPHPLTLEAKDAGARILMVPHGYLSVVQSRARQYCDEVGARLLPFGLDFDGFIDAIAEVAGCIEEQPDEVWSVAGSGTLQRGLQRAWPDADFHAVQIGKNPDVGSAALYVAPEKFEDPAELPPPFPSCPQYDAKAWRFMRQSAKKGALFWNVAK